MGNYQNLGEGEGEGLEGKGEGRGVNMMEGGWGGMGMGEEMEVRELVSMLSSKHQHLEQLTMLRQKSFLFYTHKVDNSSKFKAHLLPPRKAMLTPLGTAWATTCA